MISSTCFKRVLAVDQIGKDCFQKHSLSIYIYMHEVLGRMSRQTKGPMGIFSSIEKERRCAFWTGAPRDESKRFPKSEPLRPSNLNQVRSAELWRDFPGWPNCSKATCDMKCHEVFVFAPLKVKNESEAAIVHTNADFCFIAVAGGLTSPFSSVLLLFHHLGAERSFKKLFCHVLCVFPQRNHCGCVCDGPPSKTPEPDTYVPAKNT